MSNRIFQSLRSKKLSQFSVTFLGIISAITGVVGAFSSAWILLPTIAIVALALIEARFFAKNVKMLNFVIEGLSDASVRPVPYSISYLNLLESMKSAIAGEEKLRSILEVADESSAQNLAMVLSQVKLNDEFTEDAKKTYSNLKGYYDI